MDSVGGCVSASFCEMSDSRLRLELREFVEVPHELAINIASHYVEELTQININ